MQSWQEIGMQISAATHSIFTIKESHAIGGGCINQAYRITDGARRYFVKLNTADSLAMFESEAVGLMEIHQSETIRVPLPICYGQDHHSAWLVLEHLDIHQGIQGNAADLGTQLTCNRGSSSLRHRKNFPVGRRYDRTRFGRMGSLRIPEEECGESRRSEGEKCKDPPAYNQHEKRSCEQHGDGEVPFLCYVQLLRHHPEGVI